MATKNAKLVKLISGVITDLMVQTTTDNVIYSENITLSQKLTEILSSMSTYAVKGSIDYVDLVANLKALIDGKATKGTTLAAYGINDAYTKTQIDGMIAGAFEWRGTKDYQSQLPATGNINGDVWQVKYRGTAGTIPWDAEFAWNGTAWIEIGGIVDLSGYVQTSRKINNKALTADIVLTPADVGAVPTTRKVNGKTLDSDVTLSASDVGAGKVILSTSAPTVNDMTDNDLWIQTLS